MGYRNKDGTIRHGVVQHDSVTDMRAYALAVEDEREAARELASTHPRADGRVLPVLAWPMGHHTDIDALAKDLIDGKIQGHFLHYCRGVMAWMKKYPDLWRPWHTEFNEAVERARK